MKRKYFPFLLCAILCICATSVIKAQDAFVEGGVNLGGAFYLGDLNPSVPFHNTHPAFGFNVAYNFNYRVSCRLTGNFTTVSGGQDKFSDRLPPGDYSFSNPLSEYSFRLEMNFFKYTFKPLQPNDRFQTPYIFAGIGFVKFGSNKRTAIGIPVGVGYRYKLTSNLNVGVEWEFTPINRDDLDELEDPYHIGTTSFINRDWFSTLSFFVTVDIFKNVYKCVTRE